MRIGRYILSGILTIIPLWVTWIVFDFVLRQLAWFGRPFGSGLTSRLAQRFPQFADWPGYAWLDEAVAVVITLVGFYLLGWLATRMVGRQLIGAVEAILARVPLVQQVYGAVKKLVIMMQQKPEGSERVVLIEFPTADMRAVGLVTRVLTEPETGRKLAVVYVPTTPNPTSGYMEIVPLERVVATDWTLDEAMNFIVSAGAVAPERIYYSRGASGETAQSIPATEPPAAVKKKTRSRKKAADRG